MSLHWTHQGIVVDASTLAPGKSLMLESSSAVVGPLRFEVFEVYGPAMRKIRQFVGIPERRSLTDLPAVGNAAGIFLSDPAWRLPAPRGARKSAGYVFTAGAQDTASRPVYSSRIARAAWKTEMAVNAADPTGSFPIGANGSATLNGEIIFAVDPEVSVSMLTGRELVEQMLSVLREQVASDDPADEDVAARVEARFDELRDVLDAAYTPPWDWSVDRDEFSLVAEADETSKLEVTLDIPSAGDCYIALAVFDANDPTGAPIEISDPWAVRADEDGMVTAVPNPYFLDLPRPQAVSYAG